MSKPETVHSNNTYLETKTESAPPDTNTEAEDNLACVMRKLQQDIGQQCTNVIVHQDMDETDHQQLDADITMGYNDDTVKYPTTHQNISPDINTLTLQDINNIINTANNANNANNSFLNRIYARQLKTTGSFRL